jgi:uncharacterized protein (TIGR03437 family)
VGDNGAATQGLLLQAEGIASDSGGNLYVSDAADHRVRKVTPAGIITTVAGTGIQGFSGDGGPAGAAQLNSPYGLILDGTGNLYIADLGNARIRRVTPDGTISTVAGGGSEMVAPRNLALDGHGGIYISDFGGHRVFRLSSDGSLTTVAGTGVQGFSPDGTLALSAQLAYPTGLAVDRQGALYVADSQNHWIRKVTNGVISSLTRAATPTSMVFDGLGSLYIADPSAGQIVQIPAIGTPNVLKIQAVDLTVGRDGYLYAVNGIAMFRISFIGPSTVLAGGGNLAFGDHGSSTLARLNHPSGVAADSRGNFYIADRDNNRIRQVATDGTITTVAGTGVAGNSGDGGLATQAQLNAPSAISVDPYGNLYVADTGNQRVREVTLAGLILAVSGTGITSPAYVAADAAGRVYVTDSAKGTISQVSATGQVATLLAGLQSPRGLALDTAGDIYFTEAGGPHVRKLDPLGNVTNLGEGLWNVPRGIAVTAAGDIFVADTGRQQILRIDSSGVVTPVAGTGIAGFTGDGGPALSGELGFPWDVAAGPNGTLFVADLNNNRIRLLTPGPVIASTPVQVVAVNAASLQPGPIAPGMLVRLQGAGLSAQNVILFNGIQTPALTVDHTGLVVQAPGQISGLNSVQVEILAAGGTVAEIPEVVAAAAPALFADASGQALANNQDGTVNSSSNPVSRGSMIVLYGTGEGVSGLPVSVTVDNNSAQISYAGPVAGYPGLLQINAVVPTGYVAPGNLAVAITVGQWTSQSRVTIAVR